MTTAPTHRPLQGIAFCVFALLGFAVQDTLVKSLTADYPLLQVLVLRSVVLLLILVPVARRLGVTVFGSKQPKPLLLRGVLAFLAFTSYYLALTRVPLADAAAVYMTAPLFVTLLSVPLLRERVGVHRWVAVLLGFAAVVVMLDPGSALFRIESAIPLFSALCYATIPILNRRIGLSEHAVTMAIYTTVAFVVLCLSAAALLQLLPSDPDTGGLLHQLQRAWRWPGAGDALLIAASGAVFTIALLSITQAYRIAIVSSVAPFEYSYLMWATLLGYLVFGDVPGARTLLGGAVVVACGCYIIYRERPSTRRTG